jgi:pimeloyl-ACP methyl ester carboxylesterase
VVKDYGRRSRLARLVGPLLVRHELAMLERLEGIAGLPRSRGRLGRYALAMDFVDGGPLRRHGFPGGLPAAFFDALDGMAAAVAARGVVHLDLRSPTNVLCTSSGAPAIVDLGSAFPLPVPRWLARRIHARAVRKLRRRFQSAGGAPIAAPSVLATRDLAAAGQRFRIADAGSLDDAVPALLLHDVGLANLAFAEVIGCAAAAGRRAIAPDLPPFGASSRARFGSSLASHAARVLGLLDVLRVERVDVVGHGWGGLVGRALAARAPGRVRSLLTLDTPLLALRGRWPRRWEAARDGGPALREVLESELPAGLDAAARRLLRAYLVQVPARTLARTLDAVRVDATTGALRDPLLPGVPWLAVVPPTGEPPPDVPSLRVVACERPEAWLGAAEAARLWKELEGPSG